MQVKEVGDELGSIDTAFLLVVPAACVSQLFFFFFKIIFLINFLLKLSDMAKTRRGRNFFLIKKKGKNPKPETLHFESITYKQKY